MAEKEQDISFFSDNEWLNDLAFLTDLTHHLSDLNIKLQGKDQLCNKMFQHVLAFESKLQLFLGQLSKEDTFHFELLTTRVNISPANFEKYANCIKTLSAEIGSRFGDFRRHQKIFQLFANPFRVDASDYPSTLQLELLDMQSNFELKNAHSQVDLLRFYLLYVAKEEGLTNIKEFARRCVSYFGSTYRCEQFFSKMKHVKTKYRAQLSDPSLRNQLRISHSSIRADINKLVDSKQCQISH